VEQMYAVFQYTPSAPSAGCSSTEFCTYKQNNMLCTQHFRCMHPSTNVYKHTTCT